MKGPSSFDDMTTLKIDHNVLCASRGNILRSEYWEKSLVGERINSLRAVVGSADKNSPGVTLNTGTLNGVLSRRWNPPILREGAKRTIFFWRGTNATSARYDDSSATFISQR